MANFEPRWDLKADANTIKEGQQTFFELQISKYRSDDTTNFEYVLGTGQYLQVTYTITGTGDTLEERDFKLSVGESTSTLVPIADAGTGVDLIQGTHVVNLVATNFQLGSATFLNAYYFKIECPQDGIWDGPESLTFNIDSVNVISTLDGEISNIESSGVLVTSTQILNYNTADEIWVTPDLITHGSDLYTIGEISYGSESRIYVQAFGQSQIIGGNTNIFMPAYEIETITLADIPSTHITGSGTILVPDLSGGELEEIPLLVQDITGTLVSSGLKFNGNNGQIVQTMLYDSDPIDAYIKVKVVSVKEYYTTEADAYKVNKRFRAYQTWVAPTDISNFSTAPIPGHLYQLKDTTVYPYVIQEVVVDGITKILFDADKWYDLGVYNETLGATIINQERMFRVVFNDSTGGDLSFDTDANLGEIHVGEYFGHTVYPVISASGSDLVTYEINHATSPNDILKYNLDLSADGYMIGTAYATSADFSTNDNIVLEFDVIANGKNGKNLTKRFNITIVRGLGQNTITANICPSVNMERAWFGMISTNAFNTGSYYRESDPRYGRRKVPRILLKENFVDTTKTWEGISTVRKELRNGIVDTTGGSPVPDGTFKLVLGNYKIRSALDNLGNVLYDVLYRELHSSGTQVTLSINPLVYTDYSNNLITEVYGLRQNIYNILGEDTTNLLTDPTDLSNRGITVDAISGLSVEMIDTVPRFMNHPYVENNISAMYFPCIPVGYFKPGQAEVFFSTLVQNNEHGALLNYEFEIPMVEFWYYVQDYARYVPEKFTAALLVPNLFQ